MPICLGLHGSPLFGNTRRSADRAWSVAGTTNLAPKGPRSGHTHHLGNSPRQGVIFSRYLHHGPLWRENKPEFSVFHEKLILGPQPAPAERPKSGPVAPDSQLPIPGPVRPPMCAKPPSYPKSDLVCTENPYSEIFGARRATQCTPKTPHWGKLGFNIAEGLVCLLTCGFLWNRGRVVWEFGPHRNVPVRSIFGALF